MSAVGLGKGLPAPSCWKLHPLCGGMERGPETPPPRGPGCRVHPTPRAGLGPSSQGHPPRSAWVAVLQGAHLSWSLCAEPPTGSFPSSEGSGCRGGQGALAPLCHGQSPWAGPIPSRSIGLCCLPAIYRLRLLPPCVPGPGSVWGPGLIWGVEPRAGKDQECAWGAGSCPGGCTARWGLWWAAALGATQHEVGVALEMGPVPNRGTWPLRGSMCGGTGPPAVTGPARAADGAVAGQAAGWWLGAALDPSGDLSSLGIPGGGGVPSPHLGMVARGSPHVGPGGAETTTLALQIGHLYLVFFFFL